MDYLLFFLIVMAAAFILPEIAKKIQIPYVTAIIIAGNLIGPIGFNLINIGETAIFLAGIGAIFLMFTAGLAVKLSHLKRIRDKIAVITIFNAGIPFIVGYFITSYFGYNTLTSIVIGTIFVSSSVGVIVPTLKETKLIDTKLGKSIISAAVFEDTTSLLILAILLQYTSPQTNMPIPVYVAMLLVTLIFLIIFLPRIEKAYIKHKKEAQKKDIFERELRFVFVVLIATALFFELIGIHAIIAGFLVGLILADVIKHRMVFHKIHTIGYGIFIPIFFLIIGMKTDLSIVIVAKKNILITLAIVFGLIFSKFFSGWLSGMLLGYKSKDSSVIGAATIPQLSTTLVVALAAQEFHLLDNVLVTAIVVLSIVTTLASPSLVSFFHKRSQKEKLERQKILAAQQITVKKGKKNKIKKTN